MRLVKKLNEWHQQGLIDNATVSNIVAYEQGASKPIALWAAGGIGALTIIIGLVSVVAANWAQTPDEVKLGVDLLIAVLIAFALFKVCTRQAQHEQFLWLREVLVITYYGFVLASMALIGQTYQLGGSIAKLLAVWTIVCLPLVLLGRGRILAALWVTGSALTWTFGLEEFYRFLTQSLGINKQWVEPAIVSLYLLAPVVFILLSRIPWLLRHRPLMADHISRWSWLAIVVLGFVFQFLWYERIYDPMIPAVVVICSIAIGLLLWWIPTLYATYSPQSHLAMRGVLALVLILGVSGSWHSENRYELVGAITNLIYLCVLAWAALKIGAGGLFNLATAIIGIRILFVYFEIFGSMLETGLGLITGGALTLLFVWLWIKKSGSLANKINDQQREINSSGAI
jgi:uncharacterized membrane protein